MGRGDDVREYVASEHFVEVSRMATGRGCRELVPAQMRPVLS